jgi:galactose mutarotase-like enzyme
MSFYSKKTQTEYLWQGDPAYWKGRAYNLFPIIGRMFNNIYTHKGQNYTIRAHGVARYNEFILEERSATKLVFLLKDNEETFKEYPFHFEFRAFFEIVDSRLNVRYEAKNVGNEMLPCAFGGHPGINVPFGEGCFEDYYLEFSEKTNVHRQLLSDSIRYMANKSEAFPLEDGVRLPLKHNLFDYDAVILENTSRCVSVKSTKDPRYVTMEYPDYKYIGFWHVDHTDAPYVCLEPWGALPAEDGVTEDLTTKRNMLHVQPNQTAEAFYSLEIHE